MSGRTNKHLSAICSRTRADKIERIFVTDAHRDDGKRFVARADELLTAFLELESAISAANAQRIAEGVK